VDTFILGLMPEEGWSLMGRTSRYPAEFREQAVEMVLATGRPIAQVARELQINDCTLGNWVKADRAERGVADSSGLLPLTAAERAELTRLRRENATLRVEREILKKAAAFFVTESTR
jgi:transposase